MSSTPLDQLYMESLLDEVKFPTNKQLLENPDVTQHERNASCGDEVTVTLQLSPDRTTIQQLGWDGAGCIISQATCSVLASDLTGKPITEILEWGEPEVLQCMELKEIAYGRKKCLLLCLHAVQTALKTLLQENK